ncbi:MAG: hypothetical protein ABIH41_04170 [Nanoarchaeota archaeon]
MVIDRKEVELFADRFRDRVRKELGEDEVDGRIISREYQEFKEAYLPKHMSLYETFCRLSAKLLNLRPGGKQAEELQRQIDSCHLDVTPTGAMSFTVLGPFMVMLIVMVLGYAIPFALFGEASVFFVVLGVFSFLGLMLPAYHLPRIFAENWRIKASNQMILCTFYVVTYMRHTSNLELAIDFAAEHLDPPLSLDLKKIIWNIETQRFDSIKESVDDYLAQWRQSSPEFVESMHLIESSLYESAEERRLNALDKSLSVMLDETYEKMLHYAHDLKTPITTLHMLGVILPVLGLVILPLATAFTSGVKWYHIFALYNLILPVVVYIMGKSILSKRPTGYGSADLSGSLAVRRQGKSGWSFKGSSFQFTPFVIGMMIFGALFLIGIIPLIMHAASPGFDCIYRESYDPDTPAFLCAKDIPEDEPVDHSLLQYVDETDQDGNPTGKLVGPYGIGATMLSLCLTLAFGLGAGVYYRMKTASAIKVRWQSKRLEQEFASALFQLGNRLGDGIPAEIAFSKVAAVMEGTVSGKFFHEVSDNISKMGMGLEQAIFDEKSGALVNYPSNLIESSMKVLLESSKKGPLIASQALINVAEYVKQMHRVDERLNDLMADVIGSMKSQVSFLTPAIAGIVIGITSMMTRILIVLGERISSMSAEDAEGAGANIASLASILGGQGLSTYFFQGIVGLYVVQLAFLLTILVNGIINGDDKLNEQYSLGQSLIKSTLLYTAIAGVVILSFNLVAGGIVNSVGP